MSKSKSGCGKGALGCAGVGCFLVIAAVAAGFAFAPQIKEIFKEGLEKGLEAAKQAVENHPVYREALARAETDPRVTGKLGTPIEAGLPESINLQHRPGGARTLEMDVGISGPEGEGRLEVVGTERDGEVSFSDLVFWTDGEGLDLLKAPGVLEAPEGGE